MNPDNVAFSTVINAWAKTASTENALKCFNRMRHAKVNPNEVSYCNLINAYSRESDPDSAASWLMHGAESGLRMGTEVHNAVIGSFAKACKHREAGERIADMEAL